MQNSKLVSVIVPNYNYGKSLRGCLTALKAQTYEPMEIIVVDDHSTDDSVDVAREFGVKVLQTPTNSGVATARNLGSQNASGSILMFVDSDVAPAPDAVAESVAMLESDPSVGAACGVYEDTPMIRDSMVEECRCVQAYYWRMSSLGEVSFLFSAICALRAEVFAEIGPFNPRLRQTEEVDYGQRLSQHYKILLSPRIHGRHDDDDQLWPLLRKLFRRARLRIPLYAQRKRFARGFETASRAYASLATLITMISLIPAVVFGSFFLLVPIVLLGVSLWCDRDMYQYVVKARGWRFCAAFVAIAFMENLAISSGVVVGVVHWLLSRSFRHLYDRSEESAPMVLEGQRSA
jgi:glycosyltransferase involved in cell wall biosynthesis